MKEFQRRTRSAVALGLALSCLVSSKAWSQDPAVVATVNGKDISIEVFQTYVAGRIQAPYAQLTAEQKDQFLDELVDLLVVAADARNRGLEKSDKVRTKIEIQNNTILAQAAIEELLGNKPVTDADIEAAYEEHIKGQSLNEYKARHILHENEADAAQTIADLKDGGDFATLAQERSTGPTGPNGGDLGWFSTTQMVKPFGDAVMAAEPGVVVAVPVETQFGWHVILVEDRRESAPPSLEELRQQLLAQAQSKILDDYLDGLRNSMKIEKKL